MTPDEVTQAGELLRQIDRIEANCFAHKGRYCPMAPSAWPKDRELADAVIEAVQRVMGKRRDEFYAELRALGVVVEMPAEVPEP